MTLLTPRAGALGVLLLLVSTAGAEAQYPALDREPACQSLTPAAAGGPRPQNPDVLVLRFLGIANYELRCASTRPRRTW